VAVPCFVLFFHSIVASTDLTCSGSLMSHNLVRLFSLLIAVPIVSSARPFLLSCQAWLIMLSSLMLAGSRYLLLSDRNLPWLTLDTFVIASFALSFFGFIDWRYLKYAEKIG